MHSGCTNLPYIILNSHTQFSTCIYTCRSVSVKSVLNPEESQVGLLVWSSPKSQYGCLSNLWYLLLRQYSYFGVLRTSTTWRFSFMVWKKFSGKATLSIIFIKTFLIKHNIVTLGLKAKNRKYRNR